MLALVLGIAAAAGWVIFDVAVSIVTYPLLSREGWWAFVISGAVLVLLTIAAEILNYRARQRGEQKHSDEHALIAGGTVAVFEQLRAITDTTGAPVARTIEVATEKIERLAAKVYRHEAIFWGVLDPEDKRVLTTTLIGLGSHSVTVVADANMDCCELARDFKKCFRDAGWSVAPIQLTGSYWSAGASGLSALFKSGRETLQRPIVSALSAAAHGQCTGMGGGPAPTSSDDRSDVTIIVGPKRMHYDDE